MAAPASLLCPPFTEDVFHAVLALNNDHAEELSFKTPKAFLQLLAVASFVRAEPAGLALLVAMHQDCSYNNPNFRWLSKRFRRFYYIDRVVVSAAARGLGLARRLYDDLEQVARREGHERLVCEINSVPANPGSDALHVALGFAPVGEQVLQDRGKTVRYWAKELGQS